MNCSPSMCIALLLISLASGMFLLYKTQKENLNTFFKVVSWFIIVVSIGAMISCAICCIMKCCTQQCGMGMERCGPGGYGECGPGGMNKRMMMYKGGAGCQMECKMESESCCEAEMECGMADEECAEGKNCCKKGGSGKCAEEGEQEEKITRKVKKDSVVTK